MPVSMPTISPFTQSLPMLVVLVLLLSSTVPSMSACVVYNIGMFVGGDGYTCLVSKDIFIGDDRIVADEPGLCCPTTSDIHDFGGGKKVPLYSTDVSPQCIRCPGAVSDPHVTGFDGSEFMLVGKVGSTYSLLSQQQHQLNIRLFEPNDRRDPGLWIDGVGVMMGLVKVGVWMAHSNGGEPHLEYSLMDASQQAAGLESAGLSWSGQPAENHLDWGSNHITVRFASKEEISISGPELTVTVKLSHDWNLPHLDAFVTEISSAWVGVHGVLGQSYSAAHSRGPAAGEKSYSTAAALSKSSNVSGTTAHAVTDKASNKVVSLKLQGTEDDYVVSGLFGTDSKFNRFGVAESSVAVQRKLQMQVTA